jgi:prophage DNA circulation protein
MDLSPWTKNLRRASFRGVQFHVEARELAGGRRIHNHEYPKRNQNFPEDMGRKTRQFTVEAYVIGDDYMSRRDRLIQACENEGEGSYVDHWGINQKVKCEDFSVSESSDEGRICRIQLKFIESAAGNFAPVAIAATANQLGGAAVAAIAAVVTNFAGRQIR